MTQNTALTLPCVHHWLVTATVPFKGVRFSHPLQDASKDVQRKADQLIQDVEDVKHSLTHLQVVVL